MSDEGTLLHQYWLLRNACVDPRLTGAAKAVLAVIMDHLNRGAREAFPGRDRIARITGLHPASVMRAVDALEEAGYFEVTRAQRRANRYAFTTWPTSGAWPGEESASTRADRHHPASPPSASTDASSPAVRRGPNGVQLVQLPASVHASASSPASHLLAPVRPQPASNRNQPSYVRAARADDEQQKQRERIAWINQQVHLGMITREQGQEQLRALAGGQSKVQDGAEP